MATIEFRAKVEPIYGSDGALSYQRVKVPEIKRHHCDMHAMRRHPVIGGLANSDLFGSAVARALCGLGIGNGYIRVDKLPEHVQIDTTGFLAQVTIEV